MPAKTVDELIASLKGQDEEARADAWQSAGPLGAAAVKPLVPVMSDADFEVARSAKRALWKIVRHAGRPDAESEQKAVVHELNALLAGDDPAAVRVEVLWMLSEIGDDTSIGAMAALLSDKALREDARMALQRIPGEKSLAALKTALAAAPEDFKPNLAASLRQRGVEVEGVPCQKLIPTKKTSVKSTK